MSQNDQFAVTLARLRAATRTSQHVHRRRIKRGHRAEVNRNRLCPVATVHTHQHPQQDSRADIDIAHHDHITLVIDPISKVVLGIDPLI